MPNDLREFCRQRGVAAGRCTLAAGVHWPVDSYAAVKLTMGLSRS